MELHAGQYQALIADLTAITDHLQTSAHDAYRSIHGPLWHGLHTLGFTGGHVLAQGDGASTLLLRPDAAEHQQEDYSARMTTLDDVETTTDAATVIRGGQGDYDLVINTLPIADVHLRDPARWSTRLHLHYAQALASIRLTRPGGIAAILATHDLLDVPNDVLRRHLNRDADFLGAIRFPSGFWRPQAGTDNVVDLILLTRTNDGPHRAGQFPPSAPVTLHGHEIAITRHYTDTPLHLLGTHDAETTPWGRPTITVTPNTGRTVVPRLHEALQDIATTAIEHELTTAPTGTIQTMWAIKAGPYVPDLLQIPGNAMKAPNPDLWMRPSAPGPDIDL
ncbi:hypothetical protein ET495_08380 [Xylanimonas allomyrinae]|uniref:Uncharacterized protein n=1 Tax=Xylanimonas allomyrinae TaxID=2509459 RepID=A0A4P6EYW7_9MICO|nr:hypothetical protein [Xylanimonas allomyrinae]QAY63258.1 hypothetical protein ET495_08380 [Xylanimonas allomyrinae]